MKEGFFGTGVRESSPAGRVSAALALFLAGGLHGADGEAGLSGRMAAALAGTRAPGAVWGVAVQRISDGTTVFATNAHRLFIPASNTKLFTVACALDRLGPDWRTVTRWTASEPPDAAGVLSGDLVVVPGGDPGFGGRVPGDPSADFAALVQVLKGAGVRRVQGDLVVAGGWFHAGPYGAGWGWDDLPEGYGAPVSAAVAYRNAAFVQVSPAPAVGESAPVAVLPGMDPFRILGSVVTVPSGEDSRLRLGRLPGTDGLRVDGSIRLGGPVHLERMAVPDPDRWFGGCLLQALRASGVAVDGGVRTGQPGPAPRELARLPSGTLAEVAAECLKPSDNLVAQLLLLQLGRDVRENPRPGEEKAQGDDEALGAEAVRAFAGRIGVPVDAFVIEEGSGLSRKNLVTPDGVARLVRYMERQPTAVAWRAALPVGGVDGTLRNRLTGPATRGNVRAKTGTLRYVNALSGQLTTAGGDPVAFSILVNGYLAADPSASGRAEIDGLVEILAGWTGRLGP